MQISGGMRILGNGMIFQTGAPAPPPPPPPPNDPMVLVFSNTNTANIPLAGTVNVAINWGDGNTQNFTTSGTKTYTYSTTGNYEVQITGTVSQFGGAAFPTLSKLTAVKSFGNLGMIKVNFTNSSVTSVPTSIPSSINDVSSMFTSCSTFNDANIASWNTANFTNTKSMFSSASSFNVNIGGWNTANVQDMSFMFSSANSFNQPIGSWNVSNVTDMSFMFNQATAFNQEIGSWNVSKVTNMTNMFFAATAFDRNINFWNVSNVTTMGGMFQSTFFNQNIGGWDVSKVTSMSAMFSVNPTFNGNIGGWGTKVSNVVNMSAMFFNATSFNQNLNSWNTSNVTNMSQMFTNASSFNGNISAWNVSKVTNAWSMFSAASSFNQDISSWSTGNLANLVSMFDSATSFNQNLSTWCVQNILSKPNLFDNNTTSWAGGTATRPQWGAPCGGTSLYRVVNNEVGYYLQGNTTGGGVEDNATTRQNVAKADWAMLQGKWQDAWPAETTYIGQIRAIRPNVTLISYNEPRYYYDANANNPTYKDATAAAYLASNTNSAPALWKAKNAAGDTLAHDWSPTNTVGLNWTATALNGLGQTLAQAYVARLLETCQTNLYNGIFMDDCNVVPNRLVIRNTTTEVNWSYLQNGINYDFKTDYTFGDAWRLGIANAVNALRQQNSNWRISMNAEITYWYLQNKTGGRPPTPFSSTTWSGLLDIAGSEDIFAASGFGQGATPGNYPYRTGFGSYNVGEIFSSMELNRLAVRAPGFNRMGAQVMMATQAMPSGIGSSPVAADYNYARACWAIGKIAQGVGYGCTIGTNRPFFLDETCIQLGNVVGTRSAGTLYEPPSALNDPVSFVIRDPEPNGVTIGDAKFYWTTFQNALVVARLDTTGVGGAGSVHGSGSTVGYSLPNPGIGYKWQRPNAANYVNPNYSDLAMTGQDTTLNNGEDTSSSSLKPLFGESFLKFTDPYFDTRFSGLSWANGYDAGTDKSYYLNGTDSVTKQKFNLNTPKLWQGVGSRQQELQLISGTQFNAGTLVVGRQYAIKVAGNTSWTSIGAANNNVGTVFTATGAGSGTGTAVYAPDYLWTRQFLSTGGPSSTTALRITATHDLPNAFGNADQASFRWFSDSYLPNQNMVYVRIKVKIDPTWPTNSPFGLGLTEVKYNNYDGGGDKKIELSMAYGEETGKWTLGLSSVKAGTGTVWGTSSTPFVNSDPVQSYFFTSSWESKYGSRGVITPSSGDSPPSFGSWWTIEFAFRMKDSAGIVAGGGSDGWVWVAMSEGTSSTAAANGTGTQRFFVPGQNMSVPYNRGAWCIFPFLYYTNANCGSKYIDYASVEVLGQFPADASPRIGAAAGIG